MSPPFLCRGIPGVWLAGAALQGSSADGGSWAEQFCRQHGSSTALEKESGGFLGWLMAPGLCQGLLGSSAVAAQHHLCSSLWYWPLLGSHC